MMAMEPERSKALHNFSLPCLKWGNQRFLRCVKVASASDATEPEPEPPSSLDRRSSRLRLKIDQSHQKNTNPRASNHSPPSQTPFHDSKRNKSNTHKFDSDDNNIDAVREKLTTDLRVAAKKLKVSILEEGGGGNNAGPWNLRTRRAACKAPHEEEGKCDLGSLPPMKKKEGEAVENSGLMVEKKKKNERAKFSISLSKKEVEQDFLAMLGTKPPRRPKKRPRVVQRKLDTLFPGLWLTEVNAESYKVPDVPE